MLTYKSQPQNQDKGTKKLKKLSPPIEGYKHEIITTFSFYQSASSIIVNSKN